MGKQTKPTNTKRGRKIKPGKRIVDLEKESCRSQSSKNNTKISSSKTKAANYVDDSQNPEEEWRCYDCEEA